MNSPVLAVLCLAAVCAVQLAVVTASTTPSHKADAEEAATEKSAATEPADAGSKAQGSNAGQSASKKIKSTKPGPNKDGVTQAELESYGGRTYEDYMQFKEDEKTVKEYCAGLEFSGGAENVEQQKKDCEERQMSLIAHYPKIDAKTLLQLKKLADEKTLIGVILPELYLRGWFRTTVTITVAETLMELSNYDNNGRADLLMKMAKYGPPDWWEQFFSPKKCEKSFNIKTAIERILRRPKDIMHLQNYFNWWERVSVEGITDTGCTYDVLALTLDFFNRKKGTSPVEEYEDLYDVLCKIHNGWATDEKKIQPFLASDHLFHLQPKALAFALELTQNISDRLTDKWKLENVVIHIATLKCEETHEKSTKRKAGLNYIKEILVKEKRCLANGVKVMEAFIEMRLEPKHLIEFLNKMKKTYVNSQQIDADDVVRVLEIASPHLRFDKNDFSVQNFESISLFFLKCAQLMMDERDNRPAVETALHAVLMASWQGGWQLEATTDLVQHLTKTANVPLAEFQPLFDSIKEMEISKIKGLIKMFNELGFYPDWKRTQDVKPLLPLHDWSVFYETSEAESKKNFGKGLRSFLEAKEIVSGVDKSVILEIARYDEALPDTGKITKEDYEELFKLTNVVSESEAEVRKKIDDFTKIFKDAAAKKQPVKEVIEAFKK